MPNVATTDLHLVGVGMRRKRIVVDFDIYLVGVGLSNHALKKAIEWDNNKSTGSLLSNFLLQRETTAYKQVQVAVVLKMQRSVTKAQFIEAFRDSFVGVKPENYEAFQVVLAQCIGENGLKQGEEMTFYWLTNGELAFAKNGELGGQVSIDEISYRLLDVYTDPKRAVSMELYQCIDKNVKAVNEYFLNNF